MTTEPELARWNSRFYTEDFIFGEAPNEYLARVAGALAPGRALCVADGEGRNGVWLAERGWQVTSLDFSAVGQRKAAALAARRGVALDLVQADVHAFAYPEAGFDLVADVFSQFSTPAQRVVKWAGLCRAVRPGGHVIVVGYTPKQLDYRTGGPSQVDHLYTPDMLRQAFAALQIERLDAYETDLAEGAGHAGRSAVLGMLARAPG